MKTAVLSFLLSFLMLTGFAQEKTKKQLKEEQKAVKQKQTEALIDSKEFEFQGLTAYPQGYRSIDLTTNPNYMRFHKDSIDSQMPYFGRAFSGVGYGSGGSGMDFKGPILNYSVTKDKKEFTIKGEVKDNSDRYSFILTVYFEGTASLSINSNNRSSISYRGSIEKLPAKKN